MKYLFVLWEVSDRLKEHREELFFAEGDGMAPDVEVPFGDFRAVYMLWERCEETLRAGTDTWRTCAPMYHPNLPHNEHMPSVHELGFECGPVH